MYSRIYQGILYTVFTLDARLYRRLSNYYYRSCTRFDF